MVKNANTLDEALLDIDKEFGAGSIFRLSSPPDDFGVECIPTGILPLDLALGVRGGIPRGRITEIYGPPQSGKDLDVSTPIPTPVGWTTMGAIKVGDTLFDESGNICKVTYVEEPRMKEAFRVDFSHGASIVAGSGHLWNAIDRNNRPPETVIDWRDQWNRTVIRETHEIAESVDVASGGKRWRIPNTRALNLPNVDLPIPPYLLGLWLGDGSSEAGIITAHEKDIHHYADKLAELGYESKIYEHLHRTPSLSVYGLWRQLKDAGLYGNKHIPDIYLRSSVAQRQELVRGLWDSDGYHVRVQSNPEDNRTADEICLMDKQLSRDIEELLFSLGLAVKCWESDAKLNGAVVGRKWKIQAKFDFDPYTLERYHWISESRKGAQHTARSIVGVESVGRVLTRCIAVDSPLSLFLAGESMVPTHNTSIALTAVAKAQERDETCAFIDAEDAFDPDYANALGVDDDKLLVSQPTTGEEGFFIMEKLCKTGEVSIIVVDSVAALLPRSMIEGNYGEAFVGMHPKFMSQSTGKLMHWVSEGNTAVIFLNQLREVIGKTHGPTEYRPGGKAVPYYSSVGLDVRRIATIKDPKTDDPIASRTRVKVTKNKVGVPYRQCEFDIEYGVGVPRENCLLDLGLQHGLIKQSASWFADAKTGEKLGQGKAKVTAYLRENPEYADEIEREILEANAA